MEAVRRYVDAKELMTVIPLPDTMRSGRLEVIVFPSEKNDTEVLREDKSEIGSILDSLAGSIPDNGMTLEEFRAERLRKYEAFD